MTAHILLERTVSKAPKPPAKPAKPPVVIDPEDGIFKVDWHQILDEYRKGLAQTKPEDSSPRSGGVEATMARLGIPLTRTNYLDIAYPDGLPAEWTQELENELPPAIRKPV